MISPHLALHQNLAPGQIPAHDFHMHTNWTDGAHSSADMHAAAVKKGLKSVLFSEHARRTSGDWFFQFAEEVRSLPQEHCQTLVGVESKIDNLDGELDLAPAIADCVDLVMASVHRFPGEEGIVKGTANYSAEEAIQLELRLTLAAIENPLVDIIGHPFGMSLRRFRFKVPDECFLEVITKAARFDVAIEINPHYHTDLWKIAGWSKEAGAPLSLGSNAHNVSEVGRVQQELKTQEKNGDLCNQLEP